VLEPSERISLEFELLSEPFSIGCTYVYELEREVFVEAEVQGSIDSAHAPAPEAFFEVVFAVDDWDADEGLFQKAAIRWTAKGCIIIAAITK
jgi:predicted cobalt transporter CbtA